MIRKNHNQSLVMTQKNGKCYNRKGERIWFPEAYMEAVMRNRNGIKN